jgi:coenzyme F420-reducing hydrogenase alpha subunit
MSAETVTASRPGTRRIVVNPLARVEGEGELHLTIRGNRVTEATFKVVEPPRLFEAILRGRNFTEVPDITARICGICPVAYQMGAVQALERLGNLTVDPQVQRLRRLLYCGEWIESHVLHIYMLHAPDFLGYQDAIRMAADHPAEVQRGLRLKQIGNDVVRVIGGREVHPVNVRVGGFYRVPTVAELQRLVEPLAWARDAALETVRWVADFEFPDFEQDLPQVALVHPAEYPMNEGRLGSTRGLDIPVSEYDTHFTEEHVERSTALHSVGPRREPYIVGPLARYTLNYARLPDVARTAARAAGLGQTCHNPFQSIIVRAVETVAACDEALRLIAEYEPPAEPAVPAPPVAGTGAGCTEAPRGICYHRYRVDARGTVLDAKIVPPTSQNQKGIERDLHRFAETALDLPHDELVWKCEQVVRNYDPCISCSTHFLKVHLHREEDRG